jgi:hypothetical protein
MPQTIRENGPIVALEGDVIFSKEEYASLQERLDNLTILIAEHKEMLKKLGLM